MIGNLRLRIARRQNVLAIVGAGVSIATTAGEPKCDGKPLASWLGLLLHGVSYCKRFGFADEAWAAVVRQEILSNDLVNVMTAATKIQKKLGAPTAGPFHDWLTESVGALQSTDPTLIQAIRALNIQIATNNYDSLIEHRTGLEPITWRQGAYIERVLSGQDAGVVHFHGCWRDAESVVLGYQSYEVGRSRLSILREGD